MAPPSLSGVSRLCCTDSACTGLSVRVCTVTGVSVRWEFRVPEGLAERVDVEASVRGWSRTRFVVGALETWFGLADVVPGGGAPRVSSLPTSDPAAVPGVRKGAWGLSEPEVRPCPDHPGADMELVGDLYYCAEEGCPRVLGRYKP
jgi:hypothetical protein